MRYFPLFADLRGRRVLVVGGGAVAERKVRLLREAGARIDIIARDLLAPELYAWAGDRPSLPPLPVAEDTIDTAVAMRGLSSHKAERLAAGQALPRPAIHFSGDRQNFIKQVKNALFAAMIVTYAQGLAQLREASLAYNYGINLESVARVWRGGCIIRARVLEDIRAAFQVRSDLPNLLLDPHLGREVTSREADWREVVKAAVDWGLPVPGLMVSLAYVDGYRSDWLPANLIQAQRDYFGAHTYERLDAKGAFHTDWTKAK